MGHPLAFLISVAAAAGLLLAASPAALAVDRTTPLPDAAPIGLTAELEGVPTLLSANLPVPYQLDWQKRLLAFQTAFELKIQQQGAAQPIDLIETGSISAAR